MDYLQQVMAQAQQGQGGQPQGLPGAPQGLQALVQDPQVLQQIAGAGQPQPGQAAVPGAQGPGKGSAFGGGVQPQQPGLLEQAG